MRLLHFVGVLFLSSLLLACTAQKEEEPTWKKARNEMMAVHDSTMLHFSTLTELQEEVREKMQQFTPEDPKTAQGLAIIKALAEAEEGMMDWMRNYQEPQPERQTETEILAYLKQQHTAIQTVETQTNAALQAARAYLNN